MSMEVYNETPASRRKRQKKAQHVFELLNEHATCEFRRIAKHELIVPVEDYQRDESEGKIAAEIAMHYDIVAFQAIGVIQRGNGQLMVADGGTRLSAALMRKDIHTVPCLVYSGLTEKEEGDVFLRINNNRRKLRTEQLQKAEEYTGDERALQVRSHLNRLAEARVGFNGNGAMRHCVKSSNAATATLIEILVQVGNDRHVTARLMKGLVHLEAILNKVGKTLNRRPTIKRMQSQFGSFNDVVNAVVKPKTMGSANDMARALARTLRIQFPNIKE
jgi:hypothetical protein